MKYVLIGCGRISVNHIKAALNNKLEIVGLCDIDKDNYLRTISKLGIKDGDYDFYLDYKKMIETVHPDIAAIATESGKHYEIAMYCLSHGINVIVEKPMAMSIKDADEMIVEAKKNNVKLCVCHQNRFNEAVTLTKREMDNGNFGKISHSAISVRWNRNQDYYNQAKWRGTWEQDGGALMNQCIHGIDLLLYFNNSPVKSVYGRTRQCFHHYLEAEDIGMAVVEFESGSIATIEGTVNIYPKNLEETLYIFGEKGTVKIGGTSTNNIDYWSFENSTEGSKDYTGFTEETSNVYGNGHSRLYKNMLTAIENNTEPLISGEEGKKALSVVLAIYKSQKEGGIVKFPLDSFSTMEMKGYFK